MPVYSQKKPIVASLQTEFGGKGRTHESLEVVKTATMEHGSLLIAAGTEAALADVATVTMIIDDPQMDFVAVGDTVLTSVAVRECTVDESECKFSDAGVLDGTAATALIAARFIFV